MVSAPVEARGSLATTLRASPAGLAFLLSGRRWKPAPHLLLLNERLLDVAAGRCKRLIVEMPPRHGKSSLVSHWFPLWWFSIRPASRFIMTSYAAELAETWARQVRNSAMAYRSLGISVSTDSQAAHRWNTTAGGGMIAAGIGGSMTGFGADVFVIDDPVRNAKDAASPAIRDATWEWWQSTARTRLEPGAAVVLIQTRWHRDDLAGRLQAEAAAGGEPWEVLSLPAIAESRDALGRTAGEALWPERYSVEDLRKIEAAVGPFVWAALFQQRPAAAGGTIFQREWFEGTRFDGESEEHSHQAVARWMSWDTALTDKDDSAFTACVVGELTPDYRLLIRDVWRGRLQFPDLTAAIERQAGKWNRDGKLRGVVIEDKASGISAIQTLRSGSPGLRELLIAFTPNGDKAHRATLASAWCANGSVAIPGPSEAVPWLHDFEAELFEFPRGAYADQVDAFAQLVLYLENLIAEGFNARWERFLNEQRGAA